MKTSESPQTVLAENRACRVEHCGSCDALHVTVGPITLRVHPPVARLLGEALFEALEHLPEKPKPFLSVMRRTGGYVS